MINKVEEKEIKLTKRFDDVLAEFEKHGNTSPECFEMKWEILEEILSKYFS